MKIVLVHAPYYHHYLPPLGTAQLAAYIKHLGHEVEVLVFDSADNKLRDYFNEFQKTREVYVNDQTVIDIISGWAQTIVGYRPDIVAFSVLADSLMTTILLAKAVRRIFKGKIIAGGPETRRSSVRNRFMREDLVDHIIIGDGELAIEKIINGEATEIVVKEDLKDINIVQIPLFSDAVLNSSLQKGILSYAFTRGCIGHCKFCTIRSVHNKFLSKDTKDARRELIALKKKYDIDTFWFCDNVINYREGIMEELVENLTGLDIFWGGLIRADMVLSPELCGKLYNCGFRFARTGMESGSPEVLAKMCKHPDIHVKKRLIMNLHDQNIHVSLSFIIGHYSERPVDFKMTFELILEIYDYIDQFRAYPYWHPHDYVVRVDVPLLDQDVIQKRLDTINLFTKQDDITNIIFFKDKNYRLFKKNSPKRKFIRDIILGNTLYAEKDLIVDVISNRESAIDLNNSGKQGYVRPDNSMTGFNFTNTHILFTRPLPSCVTGTGPKSCAECLDILKVTDKGIMRCSEKLLGMRKQHCGDCINHETCLPCYQGDTFEVL